MDATNLFRLNIYNLQSNQFPMALHYFSLSILFRSETHGSELDCKCYFMLTLSLFEGKIVMACAVKPAILF